MTSLVGIVTALLLLIWLAYRGISVLLLAPAMALLAVLFSPGTPLLATYTQVFMPALGGFVVLYFPLFLLGAVFGKLMEASGSAHAIADGITRALGHQRAILAVVLACAVLTYGGVSLFVVAFAVYPIADALFRQAGVPKRLLPATVALGAFTFTMTALPGTPAIQNAIPMPYFGTSPFAAPGLGLVGAAVMLLLGAAWLMGRAASARAAGEAYGESSAPAQQQPMSAGTVALPSLASALLPVGLVIAANYVLTAWLIPAWDTSYLAAPRYGATRIGALAGLWAIVGALCLSILVLVAVHHQRLQGLKHQLDEGASASVLPLLNTASQVGFGAVIASLAGFDLLRAALLDMAPGNPLVSLSIAVNLLAGITGSASGGMSIALQTLGSSYLELARAEGISAELLHRVTAIATGGLDTLPHNGAVVTLLAICKLSHRQAYADIFVVAVLVPLLALVVVVTLGSTFGSF